MKSRETGCRLKALSSSRARCGLLASLMTTSMFMLLRMAKSASWSSAWVVSTSDVCFVFITNGENSDKRCLVY